MDKSNTISNISCFLLSKEVGIKKNYLINIKSLNKIFEINNAQSLVDFNNEILILDDLNKPYFYPNNMSFDQLKNDFRICSYLYPLLCFYKKKSKRIYGIYDYSKHKILFETENWLGRDIINEFILGVVETNINCRAINNGTILWQFSLPALPPFVEYGEEKLTEVAQFLGVYNGLLWVQLNGFRLLAVNCETGEKVHYLDTPIGYNNYFLNIKTGIIHILSGHIYAEFDLNNLEMKNRVEFDNKFSVWKSNYYEDDKNIYFCAYYDTFKNPNCYGIFDTQKCEIVWHKVSENGEIYFNPPQANETMMGILDDKGTLIIYEKDEITV